MQRIEGAFEETFGTLKVQRALDSFTRIMRDETFVKDWPGMGRQEAFSFVEGLLAKPFHDIDAAAGERGFAWAAALEKQAGVIAAELKAATAPDAAEKLARSGSRVWSAAARADAAGYGPEWRTLVLQDRGRWDETNAALFPATVKAVRDARVPSVECFFARQAPGSGIKPHSDGSNFIMTAHLGLDVPEGKCWLKARGGVAIRVRCGGASCADAPRAQVGDETRGWANGKMLVFDTSFIHETFNEGNQARRRNAAHATALRRSSCHLRGRVR